jgi:hypothetical protein
LAGMNADRDGRASHVPYLEAVRRCLEARDVRVADVRTSGPDERRNATMLLRPGQAADTGQPNPGDATATWDEENGWALAARRDPDAVAAAEPVRKGLDVLPDPDDVAAWAVVLLAHPELTPSREDRPFRAHGVPDPAFEELLARYA